MYYSDCKTKLEHASWYAERGWHVFPCHTLENGVCSCGNVNCGRNTAKHPVTARGVNDATTDPKTLGQYFTGQYDGANIALACGESSGVWVIDVDDYDALAALEAKHGPLPGTPVSQTGRGFQYFFRWRPELANLKNATRFCGALDVRTTGGYVILPPSVHATGKTYKWIVPPDDCEPADAPEWLIALCPKRDDPPTATATVPPTPTETTTNPFTIHAEARVGDRVRTYLDRTPPAVSGENGHATTYGVLCRLFEAFPELRERDEDELLTLLETWNERCLPAWSERELIHKIRDARKRVSVDDSTTTLTPTTTVTVSSSPRDGDTTFTVDDHDPVDDHEDADDWPTLHADAYHGIVGEFVRRVEPHTEADPVALAMTFLNAFGSVVGRSAHVRVGGGRHHTNTFLCVVGSSSRARKGTSLDVVLDVFQGVDVAWKRVSGLSSGEGVIGTLRDREAEDGALTIPDKRLWVVETEFGQTLRVLKRDGNTLSGVVRNAWDRGELSVLTRHDPLTATGCHVSVLAHITRDELNRYLDDVDVFNGFANRFLWALVKRSKFLPLSATPDVDDLRQRLAGITQTAKRIGEVRFSPSAATLWRAVYPSLVAEKRGLWDAATSRGEAQTLRLALVYALLSGSPTIDEPHLRAALAVWRYCDDSARIVFFPPGGDGGGRLERQIRTVVRERPGLTRTELRNAIDHKLKSSTLSDALAWLVGRHEIVERPTDTGATSYYPATRPVMPPATTTLTPTALEADRIIPPVEFLDELADPEIVAEVFADDAPATLPELLDWRNAHGAKFVRRSDGVVWVTPEDGLTPGLRSAIDANQEALAAFLPIETSTPTPTAIEAATPEYPKLCWHCGRPAPNGECPECVDAWTPDLEALRRELDPRR
jgi:hypothetical protein